MVLKYLHDHFAYLRVICGLNRLSFKNALVNVGKDQKIVIFFQLTYNLTPMMKNVKQF